MVQNWQNYAAYYVVPYTGQRGVQEIDGAVCDALYAKLRAEGRPFLRPGLDLRACRGRAGRVLRCTPASP